MAHLNNLHHRQLQSRASTPGRMPAWLRPKPPAPPPPTKLTTPTLNDLSLANNANLDCMARGEGTPQLLWQIAGGVMTFHRIAQLIGHGEPEMARQGDLIHAVIDRYERTGRVGYSGPEYQQAKEGVLVMELLAELVDEPTAIAAAEWSERQVLALAKAGAKLEQMGMEGGSA